MIVTQQLSSGLHIKQDFKKAVRMMLFDTLFKGWEYATHGGTAFIVNYKSQFYGIFCVHTLGDFKSSQIALTNTKFGDTIAGVEGVYYVKYPVKWAVDSDVLDMGIIEFSEDCDAEFFQDCAYVVDEKTISTSKKGDVLKVAGNLKSLSKIEDKIIKPIFCDLEFNDEGHSSIDIVIRKARGKFENTEFNDVKGISGAPVFNVSQNALVGIVVRGGLRDSICNIRYVDFFDILEILKGAYGGGLEVNYQKVLDS